MNPVPETSPCQKVAISACLLGLPVRYDGGDKAWPLVAALERLGVCWLPFCPEAECGLGVPRESMRLQGDPEQPRLVTLVTGIDHTERLLAWSGERLERLAAAGVAGFLFKSRSPSCGLGSTPVHDTLGDGRAAPGSGLFARACGQRFSALPQSDAELLADEPALRAFLARLAVTGRV
ncbi:MAG: DUF523 domain-containing protein [Magnetococcales bacterium]|nr:DUF523 domain-containing protein [Magnetococcales bacterium]